ncbi:Ribosomal lysine N-methyltransferase 3 [Pseudozyma hubeiensis]|nr:Ribosomal lysine N-methyltransferase 3 [Pseudozyma hubeiensis]
MAESSTSAASPRVAKRQRTQRSSSELQSRSSIASSAASTSSREDAETRSTSCSSAPTTRSQPPRLKRFLSWCQSQGLHINSSLDLRYSGDSISWSIAVHADSPIDNDVVVATIPKSAVLSRKTSALSSVLNGKWLSDSHETVGLELALCLLYERCLGSASKFEPFISILPRLPVSLPFLRETTDDTSAWRWISGTEADRIDHRASLSYHLSTSTPWPYSHDYGMSKAKALDYFFSTGIPILARSKLFDATQRQHLDGLEGAFLTAYTHVSSRDFIVDTYHGVGLVPVADLFNHAEVHTVQFESDQDVCELCGTAFLTGHEEEMCRFGTGAEEGVISDEDEQGEDDAEPELDTQSQVDDGDNEGAETASATAKDDDSGEGEAPEDHVDTLDMRTLSSHARGAEMYNTYGPLTNALLLTRYGFCLDTETDMERFTVDLRFPLERKAFFQAFLSEPASTFKSIHEVSAAFDELLSRIADRFPRSGEEYEDEDEETEDMDPALRTEGVAIDALHQLDQLLPSSQEDWLSYFCPLYAIIPDRPEAIDEDLVDRDQIHPLFISSTGRTSLPLFLLTFLLHGRKMSSALPTHLSDLKLDCDHVQRTLRTLHRFWSGRLTQLYINDQVEVALQRLEDHRVEYVEKACIQHAYQEYAATQAAIASLQDLLSPAKA